MSSISATCRGTQGAPRTRRSPGSPASPRPRQFHPEHRRPSRGTRRSAPMIAGLLITTIFGTAVWLVFFRFRWIRFTPGWGIISGLFGVHILLIFLIGLRFVTPASTDAKVVQYTIQLIPRLPEPTLVTGVLVEEGTHVKKGQTLFQFDRTVYESRVHQLEAELAKAEQNVKVLRADVAVAKGKQARLKSELAYDEQQKHAYDVTAAQGFTPQMQADLWNSKAVMSAAALDEADSEV